MFLHSWGVRAVADDMPFLFSPTLKYHVIQRRGERAPHCKAFHASHICLGLCNAECKAVALGHEDYMNKQQQTAPQTELKKTMPGRTYLFHIFYVFLSNFANPGPWTIVPAYSTVPASYRHRTGAYRRPRTENLIFFTFFPQECQNWSKY